MDDGQLSAGQGRHSIRGLLGILSWAILLGVVALVPHSLGLADFYTIDEAYHWPYHVREFSEALRTHHWAATNRAGHPGVTTMWLGSLGRWLALRAGIHSPGIGDGALYLSYLRLPVAVVNGLAVVVGYLLLRRLLRPGTALLAAALWAVSPFVIAHSRLLHLDALLTSFITLSLLLLLIALDDTEGVTINGWRIPLLLSGVFGGLALLTKGPSLMLPPLVGLYLLLLSPKAPWRQRVTCALRRFFLWFAVAAVVFVALWPAMWVTPVAAVWRVLVEVVQNGGQPHDGGNFFFGRAVPDPDPFFYPVVVVWRGTPVMLFGLLLLPFALWERSRERRILVALGGFAVLFALGLTIGQKKLDRYLLPIWPSLEILAATGIRAAINDVAALIKSRSSTVLPRVVQALTVLVPMGAVLTVGLIDLRYYPYYLSYFNPLLGGGAVAERVVLVSWGEGLEQVGSWLSQRPDIKTGPVLS